MVGSNIVISVTTIPDRIGHIGPCLESLVAQGYPVYLWAVPKIARSETRLSKVPKFQGVNVEVVADRGPITKLLPALERGFQIILTADDDVVYGKDWAETLLIWNSRLPGAALGYRGRLLKKGRYSSSILIRKSRIGKPRQVSILTGVEGALYPASIFDEGIFEEWKLWPMNDDLVLAAHLKRRGIPSFVVPGKCSTLKRSWQHIQPLYQINRRGGDSYNDEGVKQLGLDK